VPPGRDVTPLDHHAMHRTASYAPTARCALTWVVARFGSFSFMFYQYLVPFPPRSPAAAPEIPSKLLKDDDEASS